MKYKTTEEFLLRYKRFKAREAECIKELEIAQQNAKLQELEDIESSICTINNNTRVSSSNLVDVTAEKAIECSVYVDENIEYLRARIIHFQLSKNRIKTAIDNADLSEKELRFVELRYLQGKSINDIMREMGYEKSSIYKFRLKALCKITTVI